MSREICYRIAKLEDRDELVELLKNHYYPNEPFNTSWVNDDPVPEDIEMCLVDLGNETCYVAVDEEKGIIVGACLAGEDAPSVIDSMLSEATQTSNQKWANYLRLYARLAKEANIFQRFNVDKIFHISAMIVHSDYQRRSIGTKFAQKSFALGASLNYKYCSINCSSIYTQNIAEKFNMELVGDIPMDDIKNEKGERLVFPTPPHTRITTYVKRL